MVETLVYDHQEDLSELPAFLTAAPVTNGFAVLNSVLEEVHDCLHTQVPPPSTPPTKRCHRHVPRALICTGSVFLRVRLSSTPHSSPPFNPETGRRAQDHTTPGSSGHDDRWRWQRAGVALLLQLSWDESLR
ncbi:hypothetical protein CDAR_607891 [Caerostris darwini]|uniref:Uncharacterized protein n=1 Tax=Caerostris darwini TaxID=1538125 RepID=A0AAV4ULY9_9ARAC|nr:hypothetical protein CDAR_607891 [Caerostris darwini]